MILIGQGNHLSLSSVLFLFVQETISLSSFVPVMCVRVCSYSSNMPDHETLKVT